MEQYIAKKALIHHLQKEILLLEGFKPANETSLSFEGLEVVEAAFPNAVFPTGALHEFVSTDAEHAAASSGFIAGLLHFLTRNEGICFWISTRRKVFPPALQAFGIAPHRIFFMELPREKDVLWAVEEALKCKSLAAVIAEVNDMDFARSRRLQLVMEKSKVTAFVLVKNQKKLSATACVARWRITPIASQLEEGMPGVGFPRWNVELLKVRNGNPGSWKFEWGIEGFKQVQDTIHREYKQNRQAG